MQQQCVQCGRVAIGEYLWCQQADCPSGNMPFLFAFGEYVGDVQVVKPLILLSSATVYQGQRDETPVLLKVAHDGFHARLQREVNLLNMLRDDAHFPTLQPAYRNVPDAQYGQVTRQGLVNYYAVYEAIEGESLRDYLLRTPVPWYQYTGRIAVEIANAIQTLHQKGVLHCALSPECVFVRMDAQGNPRIVLLDLGMAGSDKEVQGEWHGGQVAATYIAPEMLDNPPHPSTATDIYGVGLIFHEMLSGQGTFQRFGRSNAELWQAVKEGDVTIQQVEIAAWLPLVRQMLSNRPNKRPASVAKSISDILPPIKAESRKIDWVALYPYVVGVLVVALLLATFVAFWR